MGKRAVALASSLQPLGRRARWDPL